MTFIFYEQNVNYRDFCLEEMTNRTNGNPIKVAEYYIWDPVLRHTLYKAFFEIRKTLREDIELSQAQNIKIDLIQNKTTNMLNLVFTALNHIPKTVELDVGLDIINFVGSSVIENLFKLFYSEPIDLNSVDYMTYLTTLILTLDLRLPNSSSLSPEMIYSNAPKKEIIRIPIYYSLHINDSIIPNNITYYMSFKDTMNNIYKIDNFFFDYKEKIYTSQHKDYDCRGKIFIIKEFNQFESISNLEEAPDKHTHLFNGHMCEICKMHGPNYEYNYTWLDLNKHMATCTCGFQEKHGHIISNSAYKNNNKEPICILCGGPVERGFIQLGINVKDDLIILSNDVIVIDDLYVHKLLTEKKKWW